MTTNKTKNTQSFHHENGIEHTQRETDQCNGKFCIHKTKTYKNCNGNVRLAAKSKLKWKSNVSKFTKVKNEITNEKPRGTELLHETKRNEQKMRMRDIVTSEIAMEISFAIRLNEWLDGGHIFVNVSFHSRLLVLLFIFRFGCYFYTETERKYLFALSFCSDCQTIVFLFGFFRLLMKIR